MDAAEFAYLGAIVDEKAKVVKIIWYILNRLQKARGAFQRLKKV